MLAVSARASGAARTALVTAGTAARATLPALAARTPHRVHFGQLLHLIGRQDGREFHFRLGFQRGDLRLLVICQIQFLNRAGRQQMEPAASPARAVFGGGRLLTVRRRRAVLGGEEAGGGAESQREEHDFCFHNMLFDFYRIFPAPAGRTVAVRKKFQLERRKCGWADSAVAKSKAVA